jgi:hypothetical protein
MRKIETMEQWQNLSKRLKEKGYKLWQFGGADNEPNGFWAAFWKAGKDDYEVVTFNLEKSIVIFNNK